ncbi:MAG TPA: hypothetical protein VGO37_01290 [Steroidobacteraceae bacterium]|jgi:hypothetical protein|nr:hypothetical protein [Steroidobacteraceae bacterium]
MSEVDRLSNSGLYPALPIADRRPSKDGSQGPPRGDKRPPGQPAPQPGSADPATPRPPKSLIDEYA